MLKVKKEVKLKELLNFGFSLNYEGVYTYEHEDYSIFIYRGDQDVFKKRYIYIETYRAIVIEEIDVLFNLYNCGIIELIKD